MLIVGININTIGDRYISYLKYDSDLMRNEVNAIAYHMKETYDEVYVIEMNDGTTNEELIAHIVLKGCRI